MCPRETPSTERCQAEPLRGVGAPVLYLDFDGVLHPEDVWWLPDRGPVIKWPQGHQLFEHAPLLEQVLADYPAVCVVLASSWVMNFGYSAALRRLPDGLQSRVVGTTFDLTMDRNQFLSASRGMQIYADSVRRQPSAWISLDDDAFGWPAWCRDQLLITDDILGIGKPGYLDALRKRLDSMPA